MVTYSKSPALQKSLPTSHAPMEDLSLDIRCYLSKRLDDPRLGEDLDGA